MFKVNSKNTRTTSLALLWCFHRELLTQFTPCSKLLLVKASVTRIKQKHHWLSTVKQLKPLPPEPQLSIFFYSSEKKVKNNNNKNDKLLYVAVAMGLATYAFCEYLK